jgi:hypothetical protein
MKKKIEAKINVDGEITDTFTLSRIYNFNKKMVSFPFPSFL